MDKSKVVNGFYKDYKKMHNLIEESLNCQSVKVSKLIDRIIIFYFVVKNLIDENSKKKIMNKLSKEGYKLVVKFYNDPESIFPGNMLIKNITTLFKTDKVRNDIYLSDEHMKTIINILNKYNWEIQDCEDNKHITPDILGNVFEKYINQKESGAFYTEQDTIKYINNNSILYSLYNKLNNKQLFWCEYKKYIKTNCTNILNEFDDLVKENMNLQKIFIDIITSTKDFTLLNDLHNSLEKLKVVDITCGTGAFLVEVVDLLTDLYSRIDNRFEEQKIYINKTDIISKVIEKNIYGVDIMDDAVEIAKFRLLLKLIIEYIKEDNKCIPNIKINIKAGNTLSGRDKENWEQLNISEESAITVDNCYNSEYFNWKLEFPEVFSEGGFCCVVGNPPYIEWSKVKRKYNIDEYKTKKCGNTYAFTIEKALNLLNDNGVIGLIVPISIVSTKRMGTLRELLNYNCKSIFYSNFGDRPDTLFVGVHQKVTILLGVKARSKSTNIYTSRYYHWYKEERDNLFKNIRYIKNYFPVKETIYKISSSIEEEILKKIELKKNNLTQIFSENGEYKIFLSNRLTFWVKSFITEKKSNEFKEYTFHSIEDASIFNAIMNSSLYYFFWEVVSDEWHITNKELEMFKFDISSLEEKLRNKLVELSDRLNNDLESKKVYIGSKQTQYEYRHKNSKIIIDKIDKVLSEYYGLTEEEHKYIIDYNLKYRMNDEYENYIRIRNTNGNQEGIQ